MIAITLDTKVISPAAAEPGLYYDETDGGIRELIVRLHDGRWVNVEGTTNITPKNVRRAVVLYMDRISDEMLKARIR